MFVIGKSKFKHFYTFFPLIATLHVSYVFVVYVDLFKDFFSLDRFVANCHPTSVVLVLFEKVLSKLCFGRVCLCKYFY